MSLNKVMIIAGETSGDTLAAELIEAIKKRASRASSITFFGAGGPKMAAAGVSLSIDLTRHAVVGLVEVLRRYFTFRRWFMELLDDAIQRQPDLIVLVDYSGFNRRFAMAVKNWVRTRRSHPFLNWNPKIVYYVSPQVWASRPGRAKTMERDIDLLISIFPFEKAWYTDHAPGLEVKYVGNPIHDRYPGKHAEIGDESRPLHNPVNLVLLPGSRSAELRRHLPVMIQAYRRLQTKHSLQPWLILPRKTLTDQARNICREQGIEIPVQHGKLKEAMAKGDLALASTGTVLLECAYFGLPTIAIYKTSWGTFQVGKRIISVPYLSMPNLLANEMVIPEFIQNAATGPALASAAESLLENPELRRSTRVKLRAIVASLGPPGAAKRAAVEIIRRFD